MGYLNKEPEKERFYNNEDLWLSIMAISFTILGICISFAVIQLNIKLPELAQSKYVEQNCNQTDLFLNAECLNNQLSSWWFYNISNVGKELNLSELKQMGGVCSHAANWYYENINKSLFRATKVHFDIDDKTRHIITLISNSQGYCNLDMKSITCFKMGGIKDD